MEIIKKVAVKDTLMQMCVGTSIVLKSAQARYTTIYPTVKRLEKSTGMRFTVTIKDVPDGGTKITRNA